MSSEINPEAGQPAPYEPQSTFPSAAAATPAHPAFPPQNPYSPQPAYAAPVTPYPQAPPVDMSTPTRVFGICYIVLAALGFLIAFSMGAIFALLPAVTHVNVDGNTTVVTGSLLPAGLILIVSVFVGVLLGLLPLITGIGLLRRASWGRVLAIVNGALILISVPVGTILGGLTLFFMLRSGAKEGYDRLSRSRVPTY